MTAASLVWRNGEVVPIADAKSFPFSQGLNYGACVYEGIRFYPTKEGPAIFRLDDHLARFARSAAALRMPVPPKWELRDGMLSLIRATGLPAGYLRPLAFYDEPKMGINILGASVTTLIAIWPWEERDAPKAVRMMIPRTRRLSPASVDLTAKIAGYYANGLLAFIEAREAGFEQPLLRDGRGFLAEGAVNNLFLVKRGELFTPSVRNILTGITRDTILTLAREAGMAVYEGAYRPAYLRDADEVFLTGTGIELERVVEVDGWYRVASDTPSPVLDALSARYRAATRGEDPLHADWLTPMPTRCSHAQRKKRPAGRFQNPKL